MKQLRFELSDLYKPYNLTLIIGILMLIAAFPMVGRIFWLALVLLSYILI
ncbi:hypothetical protein [Shewanella acanthi]|nr:hypothetical protein [Shewanella acanthi]QYJ77596.1 hypothetical protein K0H61_10610 [Shewanella acanthi]